MSNEESVVDDVDPIYARPYSDIDFAVTALDFATRVNTFESSTQDIVNRAEEFLKFLSDKKLTGNVSSSQDVLDAIETVREYLSQNGLTSQSYTGLESYLLDLAELVQKTR